MTVPYAPARGATAPSPALVTLLLLIALVALAVPIVVALYPPRIVAVPRHLRHHPVRVVPKTELPPVEPVAYQAIDPADARAVNAAVPFSTAPNPAARPFRFPGGADALARATDCMAAAMLYEAGDDPVGERAVGQVVINRARHPVYPKTICGVVFQGSERSTGCQFTFTCDGALGRMPNAAGWERARQLARAALSGRVFAPVGHATHYHTDWVVPYWSASLDKVAAVKTHLFFRWTGWWGTPPAFRRAASGDEPVVAALAQLSGAHRLGATLAEGADALIEGQAGLDAGPVQVMTDPNTFLVSLDVRVAPTLYAGIAQRRCGERAYCKFMGWTDRAEVPDGLPSTPEQVVTMSFSYLRDRTRGYDKALWNCAEFRGIDPAHCMKTQPPLPREPLRIEDMFGPKALPPPPAPEPLAGVRRKPAPAPSPVPTPTPTSSSH